MKELNTKELNILESLGDGVIITDKDLNIVYINEKAIEIVGYGEDCLGKNIKSVVEVFDNINGQNYTYIFEEVKFKNTAMGFKKNSVIITRNNIKKYLSATISPRYGFFNQFDGISVIVRDITRIVNIEIELQNQKEILSKIIRTTNFGIVLIDMDFKIKMSNRFMEEHFGMKISDINKSKIWHIISLKKYEYESDNSVDFDIQEYLEKISINNLNKEFNSNIIDLTVGLLGDEAVNNKLICKMDVQKIKTLEQEYFLLVFEDKTIENKFFRELQNKIVNAEELEKAKNNFIANITHELKTPVNGIVGMIELTLMDELNDDQKENLEFALKSTSNLINIIEDILDYTKIEKKSIKLKEDKINLIHLLQDLVNDFKTNYQDRKVDFILYIAKNIPCSIIADKNKLVLILNNLFKNSLKFTNSGCISLNVTTIYEDDTCVEIQFVLTDTGVGIDESTKNELFKSFTQGDNSYTREKGGTGLGLYIVKNLIENMNGNINIEGKKSVGTKVEFNIKFKKADETIPQIIKELTTRNKFLVVDDDIVNIIILKSIITELKYDAFEVKSGQEAIELCKIQSFDMIFMDVCMPFMDGIETTKELRKMECMKNIPIIAVTAHTLTGDKEKFIQSGMNDYIAKPYTINQIKVIIDEFVNNKNELNKNKEEKDFSALNQKMVLKGIRDNISILEKLIKKEDFTNIEHIIHLIRIDAELLGRSHLKEIAFKMELCIRKGDFESAKKYFDEMLAIENNL